MPQRSSQRTLPKNRHSTQLPYWIAQLNSWKVAALTRVLQQLSHICSGPRARPKSFCLTEAVRKVVAREIDPDSLTGTHLCHLLAGAIAQQVIAHSGRLPELQRRFCTTFPGAGDSSLAVMQRYVNSRWWLDTFVDLDGVCCGDVSAAVENAILATGGETAAGDD